MMLGLHEEATATANAAGFEPRPAAADLGEDFGEARRVAFWLLAFSGIVVGIYLPYRSHPEWWYLRFLIPAIALLIVVACGVAAQVADRARMRGVVAIGTVALALTGMQAAGARQVLALQDMEGRYRETAELVADRLPPNAVLITVWQSGSVRFHVDPKGELDTVSGDAGRDSIEGRDGNVDDLDCAPRWTPPVRTPWI